MINFISSCVEAFWKKHVPEKIMKFTGKRTNWVTFEILGIQKSATFEPGSLKKKCAEETKQIMSKCMRKLNNLKV